MTDQTEFRRRSRIFFLWFIVFGTTSLAGVVLDLASVVSRAVAAALILAGAVCGLAWMRWGLRWVKAVQPTIAPSPPQAAALDTARHRVVRRLGTIGFGVTWGIWMTGWFTWKDMPAHGWADIWTVSVGMHLLLGLVIWIPAGLLAGYLWGRVMWALFAPKTTTPTVPPAA